MKKSLIAVVLCLLACFSKAQSKTVDSLKVLLSKTTDPMERYNLLTAISLGYYRTGTGESTVDNHLERLRIALQLKNDSLIAKSYNAVGDFYLFERGDFNTGMDYCFKGIPYAEKANDKRSLSSLYCDISVGHCWLRNFPEQLNFLNKATANLPGQDHPEYDYMQLQVKLNYAVYYLLTNQPKQALPYLNACTELNLKVNFVVWQFFINSMFGYYYDKTGDKELSAIYYKKMLALEKEIASPFTRFQVKYYYINYLIINTNYDEGIIQARSMLAEGMKVQNNFMQYTATGFLKTLFDKQNRIDSAYYYSKQELVLRDTLFNQERLNKIQALAFNEKVRETEDQNRKLEAVHQRRLNLEYILIALGILALITFYLLLSRSIITNTKLIEFLGVVALLIVFEFLNLLLHPFLEKITNHSPVLMLLVLVCIAALLVPLHHRIEKWATAKLVEKNKKIRLAAAKRTIRLLSDEQLEK